MMVMIITTIMMAVMLLMLRVNVMMAMTEVSEVVMMRTLLMRMSDHDPATVFNRDGKE